MATQRTTTTLLLLIAAAVVFGFAWSIFSGRPKPTTVTPPTALNTDPERGPSAAPVTLIEFGDYQCPACADMADTLEQLLARVGGQVRHVWKDAPLSEHREARPAAVAARCAGQQDKYWEFHTALFRDQAKLGSAHYTVLATELKLNTERFGACQREPAIGGLVDHGLVEADQAGITSVPSLYINGQRVSSTATVDSLEQLVQTLSTQAAQ